MKTYKKAITTILALVMCLTFTGCSNAKKEDDGKYHIIASFYPMDILAKNLTAGIDGVVEESMADPNLGCIHDHTFSTDDLKKIEGADVYIENGLDMETFNDKIKEAYPDTAIIEASANVTDYSSDGDEINGHVWTNIDDYILQIQQVSSKLQELDPDHKEQYAANETAYIEKLNQLKSDYTDKLSAIAGTKVLVLDETLPSFCIYTKLDTLEIETDHEQESISADQIKTTIEKMNADNVKTILISKGADRQTAETIAAETGATIVELNSCMTGEVNADAYLNDMRENFELISNIEK